MSARISATFRIVDPFWNALPNFKSRNKTSVQIVTTAIERKSGFAPGTTCAK